MTRAELCRELGSSNYEVGSVVSRLNKALRTRPKRIYIVKYTYDDDRSEIKYPRAVYALGDLPDAPKPNPRRHKTIIRRSRQKRFGRVASVWEYAMPQKKLIEHRRQIRNHYHGSDRSLEAVSSQSGQDVRSVGKQTPNIHEG